MARRVTCAAYTADKVKMAQDSCDAAPSGIKKDRAQRLLASAQRAQNVGLHETAALDLSRVIDALS